MSAYRQSVQRGSEVHYEVSAIDKKENKSFAIQSQSSKSVGIHRRHNAPRVM